MSQPDNYTAISATGTTATIAVNIPWNFDGVNTLYVEQTDGVTTVNNTAGSFDVSVLGQVATIENYFGNGNTTNITVKRSTLLTQEFTLEENEPLSASALTSQLDRTIRMIQDLNGLFGDIEAADILQKAITSDDRFAIPAKSGRLDKWLGFDENGNLYLGVPTNVDPPSGPSPAVDYLTKLVEIKVIADTSYTLLESDKGKLLIFTAANKIPVTSPNDLSLGWQAMFMKTDPSSTVTHFEGTGATHSNSIEVSASKSFAWWSGIVYSQTGSNATYRFIGEIDEDIRAAEGEFATRTIQVPAGSNTETIQGLIDGIGKFIAEDVTISLQFENGSYNINKGLIFEGFNGPGKLIIEPLNAFAIDFTARPVTINNTNTPANTDYDITNEDTFLDFDVMRLNSAISITSCDLSTIKVRGIEFNAKVFPIVAVSNASLLDFKACHANQVTAFTLAQLPKAACVMCQASKANFNTIVATTNEDGNAFNFEASSGKIDNISGNGSYLAAIDYGAVIGEINTASNSNFTYSVSTFTSVAGLFISNGIAVN